MGCFCNGKGHPDGCPCGLAQEIVLFQPGEGVDAFVVDGQVESLIITKFIHIIDFQEAILFEIFAVLIGVDVILRILDHGTGIAICQNGFQQAGNIQILIYIDKGAVSIEFIGGICNGQELFLGLTGYALNAAENGPEVLGGFGAHGDGIIPGQNPAVSQGIVETDVQIVDVVTVLGIVTFSVVDGEFMDTSDGFDIRRISQLDFVPHYFGRSIGLAHLDGHNILRIGNPPGEAHGVQLGHQQEHRQGCGEDAEIPECLEAEHLGGLLQEHQAGEEANDDSHGQENVFGSIAEHIAEQLEECTHTQGEEHQEQGLDGLEGDEITGRFQLPLPVQHQCQCHQGNANGGADDHISPTGAKGYGEVGVGSGKVDVFTHGVDACQVNFHQIALIQNVISGAEENEGLLGNTNTEEQGHEDGFAKPQEQQTQEIQQNVNGQEAQTISCQHHRENRSAHIEQEGQEACQEPANAHQPAMTHEG